MIEELTEFPPIIWVHYRKSASQLYGYPWKSEGREQEYVKKEIADQLNQDNIKLSREVSELRKTIEKLERTIAYERSRKTNQRVN